MRTRLWEAFKSMRTLRIDEICGPPVEAELSTSSCTTLPAQLTANTFNRQLFKNASSGRVNENSLNELSASRSAHIEWRMMATQYK